MKLINVKRATGKTELVIKRHLETGYPIIAKNNNSKIMIESKIKEKTGTFPPKGDVITYYDYICSRGRNLNYKNNCVIIDDIDYILSDIISNSLGLNIDTITMCIECKDKIE